MGDRKGYNVPKRCESQHQYHDIGIRADIAKTMERRMRLHGWPLVLPATGSPCQTDDQGRSHRCETSQGCWG